MQTQCFHDINFVFQIYFQAGQNVHLIIAELMHFININHPALKMVFYKINNQKILDQVNPGYFQHFKSFNFPVSFQVDNIEKISKKKIKQLYAEKINKGNIEFQGMTQAIQYIEDDIPDHISTKITLKIKKQQMQIMSENQEISSFKIQTLSEDNPYYQHDMLFFEIKNFIRNIEFDFYYDYVTSVQKGNINSNFYIFSQIPFIRIMDNEDIYLEIKLQDTSEKKAQQSLLQIVENISEIYDHKINQYMNNIYQDTLQINDVFFILVISNDVKNKYDILTNEVKQEQKFMGRKSNYNLIFPDIETQYFIQLFTNAYNEIQKNDQKQESAIMQNFSQGQHVIVFDIDGDIVDIIKKTLNHIGKILFNKSKAMYQQLCQIFK